MRINMSLRALWVTLLVFAIAGASQAQVIYSNIGPELTFPFNGAALGIGLNQKVAVRFVAEQTLFLDYVNLRLWHGALPAQSVNVTLWSNSSGNAPEAVLETTSANYPLFSNPLPVTRAEFSNQTLLTAGISYWLAVSPGGANSSNAWEYSSGPMGVIATGSGVTDTWGTPFEHQEMAIRVIGTTQTTPVPESSTYGLIASAMLVGLVSFRRLRFSQVDPI